MKKFLLLVLFISAIHLSAQTDQRIYDIIDAVSAERIENDVTKLANF